MKIVHNLLQAFFGLILAGHIRKFDALGGLDIHLGVGFSKAHRVGASSPLHQFFIHIVSQQGEQDNGQHPADKEAEHGVCPLQDLSRVLGSRILEHLGKVRIGDHARLIDGGALFVGKDNLVLCLIHLYQAQVLVLCHLDKGAVVHLFHPVLDNHRRDQHVEQQEHRHHDEAVINQRFFGGSHFFHSLFLSSVSKLCCA